MVVVSHLFLFLWKSFRGRFDSWKSNLPLFGTIYFPIAPFLCIYYYPQNKLYPTMRHIKINTRPTKTFGSISIISIPTAIKNNANPITFFIALLHVVYPLFIICLILPNYSASFNISATSFSITFSSFLEENRSTTSGTISKIFVIVS